jgi:GT2 family glycosyltransferase
MPNYEDEKVMGCTGRMLPYRHDEVSNVFYRTLGYDRGAKRRVFSADDVALVKLFKTVQSIGRLKLGDKAPVPWSIGSGFLSFRRCVFDKVGYFDEKLCDTRIHTLCGGEDVDMLYRVLKNNHKVVYEPKAVIGHDEPQTIEGIVRKSYSYGIGRQLLFSKYRKDRYMLALCIGDFFFLTFAWIGAVLRAERAERKLVAAGMKGSFFEIYASLRSSIISRR